MLKLAMILGAMTTVFWAGGRTAYSALQIQIPFGTALKVTPDPSNVWSWHNTLTMPRGPERTKSFPVLVDFDGNSKMDTENRDLRVMITDIQVRRRRSSSGAVTLKDQAGIRWDLTPGGEDRGVYEAHLLTPLVLPVGSELEVELSNGTSTYVNSWTVDVHLIGRLVSL